MVRKIDFVVKSFSKVWFFYIIRLDNQNLKIQSSYKYKSLGSNKWSCNQILLDQLAALPTLGMPVDSFLASASTLKVAPHTCPGLSNEI